MKSIFFMIISTILLISMLGSAFNVQPVKGATRTWTVDDDGPAEFHTIQEAIDTASGGDTIYVYNGTYYEHVYVPKSLNIIGESKYATIIDGNRSGPTVHTYFERNINLSRLTIRNADWAAVLLEWSYSCHICDSIIFGSQVGIYSRNGGAHTISGNTITDTDFESMELSDFGSDTVTGNVISNTYLGVSFVGDSIHYNNVSDNLISNCSQIAIFFDGNIPSYYNTISGNLITNSLNGIYFNYPFYNKVIGNTLLNTTDYGIHFQMGGLNNTVIGNTITGSGNGIRLDYADKNVVFGNRVYDNTYAIFVGYESSDNVVAGNNASDSAIGILVLDHSHNNTILNNVVSKNYYGIALFSSDNNRVYHNSFIDNAQQVLVSESFATAWDDGYPSGGNYWSDYSGMDSDGDGIGDVPYVIDADNQDRYPFMNPCIHDVDVVEIVPSRSWVYQGHSVNASVTVLNKGSYAENVTVTLYYNITANKVIGVRTVDLLPGENQTISFTWSTTGVEYGFNYTIVAVAEITLDNDPTNNMLADEETKIRILGDVNDDDTVDGSDVIIAARAFGSYLGHTRWNPIADMNEDNVIDGSDLVLVARNFGKTYE